MDTLQNKPKEQLIVEEVLQDTLVGFEFVEKSAVIIETCCFKPSTSNKLETFCKESLDNVASQKDEEGKMEIPVETNNDTKQGHANTISFPQSVHGLILARKSEEEAPRWGSGILVGANIVLTAAQNVYDDEKPIRKRYPLIKFIPGAHGDETPFGEVEVDEVFAPQDYINHIVKNEENGKNEEDDYALLVLKKPVGDEAGYFGLFSSGFGTFIEEKEISIVGYSGPKLQYGDKGGVTQWRVNGKITEFDMNRGLFHYNIDANSGIQVGSGIFYQRESGVGEFLVIGVHLGKNSASWITRNKLFELIKQMRTDRSNKFGEIIQGQDEEGCIKSLNFMEKRIGNSGLSFLLKCGLNGLEDLNLEGCEIGSKELEDLNMNSKWPHLRILNLARNNFRNEGCKLLRNNITWKSLKVLNLACNGLTDMGIKEIAQNTSWPELEELYLSTNNLKDEGVILLAASNNWKNLKVLDLTRNKIGDKGAAAIAKNEAWKNLERVILRQNSIGDKGACSIAMNTFWSHLEQLDLHSNDIKDEGTIAIAKNVSWKNLKDLNLEKNKINDKGAVAVAGNVTWNNLRKLSFSGTKIGNGGAIAISKNTTWKQLQVLSLSDNQISWKGIVALCVNSTWKSIERIELLYNIKLTKERLNALEAVPMMYRSAITLRERRYDW